MLKRLSPRILNDDPRRLALAAACVLATLAAAQFLAPALTRSAEVSTFTVTADSYVSEGQPDLVHGSLPFLKVDGGPLEHSSYLRVDIPAAQRTLKKATLRVYSTQADAAGVTVRFVNDDNWRENAITFNNAPAHLGRVLGHSGPIAANAWVDIDITEPLLHNPAIANGGSLELELTTSLFAQGAEAAAQFASRETATPPQLRIEGGVTPAVSTTAAPTTSAPPTTTPPTTTPPTTAPPPPPPPVSGALYVDSASGNDANAGTSPAAAWRTLAHVSGAALNAGDHVLLKRGAAWRGDSLVITRSGTGANPIVIGAYGSGSPPLIQGGSCVELRGNAVVLREVHVDNCGWAGVNIYGAGDRVEASEISNNIAGVFARQTSSAAVITGNTIHDNNRMSVLTPGGNDDSGAFGVLLQGSGTDVSFNTISGSDAFSYDYGRDGAAVEVYGATGSNVHHNVAVNNDAFSELGKAGSADNTYAYNLVRGSTPNGIGVVTRGSGSGYGPVLNTRLFNNDIVLGGGNSQGFVCHGGCGPSILTMRNNIVQAVAKAGYADAPFDEDYNLYFGGQTQFAMGPHSMVQNPAFVNPGGGDFHLQLGSPAVNHGVGLGYSQDLDRNPVPLGGSPDLGAYERA
ncbi:MAG: DNRLRE domain-containing protein [Actinobacteria bacterium]|nr:MAG: DNRLRE domain-containing protein [Actinomycetota bacterium]